MMATKHRLRHLSIPEIKKFAQDIWEKHGCDEKHNFVKRNKTLIVKELFCGLQEFQASILTKSSSFNDPHNQKKTFPLKLASRGGNKKDNFSTIFTMKCKNNNISSQQRVALICKCAFLKLQCPDVIKIIGSDKYKLEAEYLNYNKEGQYAVINVKSLFNVLMCDDQNRKEEYFEHIRNCEWAMVGNFGLYLYEMQMQNVGIFLSAINRKSFREGNDEEKEIEQNESEPGAKINGKRSWSMVEAQEANACFPNISEPVRKRQKMIIDDDYHLVEMTNDGHNDAKTNDVDIEVHGFIAQGDNETIEGECTQSTQSSTDVPMEPVEVKIPSNDWGSPPSVNMDSLIEEDYQLTQLQCVDDIEEIKDDEEDALVNDLELLPVQSVIFHKSAKQCFDQLKLNKEKYQNERPKIIKLIADAYDGCFEGNPPNDSQMDAITKSMCLPLSLIQGPPGTGKTSTIADLVNAILLKNDLSETPKILLCAYTHKAANELLSKIIITLTGTRTIAKDDTNILLRLGEAEKCPKKLRPFCYTEKFKHYSKSKKEEQKAAIEDIFGKARVVIGTAYSCGSSLVTGYINSHQNKVFGTIIIDECTQILDPVINIIVNALDFSTDSHLVLVGDHKQLPPVIKSEKIKKSEYKTIFESLVLEKGAAECDYFTMLDIQYRMCEPLISFCNKEFYDGKIKSHIKNVNWANSELRSITKMMTIAENHAKRSNDIEVVQKEGVPIYVIRTKNGKKERSGTSWINEEEARYICQHLLGGGDNLNHSVSVGIISLYKPQASQITNHIKNAGINEKIDDIMSSTVDAFQGKEKDLIILSLVNDVVKAPTIFNVDYNRINVALSRCKQALIVVTSHDFDVSDLLDSESNFDGKMGIWRRWFRDFWDSDFQINENIDKNESSQRKEVRQWLRSIGMSRYCKIMIENGFDTMANVECAEIDDFKAIGIDKLGHRRRIRKEALKRIGVYV